MAGNRHIPRSLPESIASAAAAAASLEEQADGLRRAHYPPERNRLRAHVTLFHALPPSAEDEIVRLLGELAAGPPPEALLDGRQPNGLRLAEMLGNGPLGWKEQRRASGFSTPEQ